MKEKYAVVIINATIISFDNSYKLIDILKTFETSILSYNEFSMAFQIFYLDFSLILYS